MGSPKVILEEGPNSPSAFAAGGGGFVGGGYTAFTEGASTGDSSWDREPGAYAAAGTAGGAGGALFSIQEESSRMLSLEGSRSLGGNSEGRASFARNLFTSASGSLPFPGSRLHLERNTSGSAVGSVAEGPPPSPFAVLERTPVDLPPTGPISSQPVPGGAAAAAPPAAPAGGASYMPQHTSTQAPTSTSPPASTAAAQLSEAGPSMPPVTGATQPPPAATPAAAAPLVPRQPPDSLPYPPSLIASVFNDHMAIFAQDMATILHPPPAVRRRNGALDLADGDVLPEELFAAAAGGDPFQIPALSDLGMGHIQAQAAFLDLAGGLLMFLAQHELLACFTVSPLVLRLCCELSNRGSLLAGTWSPTATMALQSGPTHEQKQYWTQ